MIIYKVTNLVNQKVYIGQSINSLEERQFHHYKDAKRKDRPTVYFHNALLKYGFNQFKWEIVEEIDNLEELNKREIYWISFYDSTNRSRGYNLKSGGKNGGTCNEETKAKIGNTTKIKWKNPEIAEKMRDGLRKGAQTMKNKAAKNYKIAICKECGKEFTYRPCDVSGVRPTFCSTSCLHLYRVNNKKGLMAATFKSAEIKRKEREELKNRIQQWLPNFKKYKNLPLNGLTALFEELTEITGYKDPRTIMNIFEFTSRKLFFKELSKMYAELIGNYKK